MAVTATRTITVTNSSDVTGTQTVSAASNAAASGVIELKTLSSGANTITAPTGGSTLSCCTFIPPSANAQTITLKGVTGDTGIVCHLTDPTSLALASSVTSFVITAGGTITGMRFIWS